MSLGNNIHDLPDDAPALLGFHAFEPVTMDGAEVLRAQRDARAVVALRRLQRAAPRFSLQRFEYWRERRKAEADVIATARGLERRAWERDVIARDDERAALEAQAAGFSVRGF